MARPSKASNPATNHIEAPTLPLKDTVFFPGTLQTLHITRESSKRAIRVAIESGQSVFCVLQRDQSHENPTPSDLCEIGVLCEPLQTSPLPDGSLRAALRCHARGRAEKWHRRKGALYATVYSIEVEDDASLETTAKLRTLIETFHRHIALDDHIPPEAIAQINPHEPAGEVVDVLAHHLPLSATKKQEILEALPVSARLDALLIETLREVRILEIQRDVAGRVESSLGQVQRDYYLREQLRALQTELGDTEGDREIEEWAKRIEAAGISEPQASRVRAELDRLARFPASTPEGASIRERLNWILDLPWNAQSESQLELSEARASLDEAHYGLDEVKERILEFLAVRKLTQSLRGPVLCFTGPPGVGKTTVAEAIAAAMGRKFARIALGGVRDEAEMRGHRSAYVGASPGRLIKELCHCGSRNPVLLLDEIDKLGRDWRGDPSASLLEALDPNLNHSFTDHYIDLPFDLSDVLFIATANTMESTLPALANRMEIVEFPSYSDAERFHIAAERLLPRQMSRHGLEPGALVFPERSLRSLAEEYALEPGVRELDRSLATLCRKAARQIVDGAKTPIKIDNDSICAWLGPPHRVDHSQETPIEGRCWGLAASSAGGVSMPIEATLLPMSGDAPSVMITGNAGDVMRESVHAAITFLRKRAGAAADGGFRFDAHLHVGEGSVSKDGPSAGLAIALAIASAHQNRPMPAGWAATGEVGILGDVRPVGALREKLAAARREKLRHVLVPSRNRADIESLPADAIAELTLHYVDTIEAAMELCFPDGAPGVETKRRPAEKSPTKR